MYRRRPAAGHSAAQAGGVVYARAAVRPFDGYLYAIVQGEGVAFPGSYRIPHGTTYGELFALAGYAGSSPYPLDEAVRLGEDAVLGEDGVWRAYIVV